MTTSKIAIMGSTNGSVVPKLYPKLKMINAEVCVVFSNKRTAGILEKAQQLNIPSACLLRGELSREQYDIKVSEILKQHRTDIILLIGYMRILSANFVNTWRNKIINIHPSLLPKHAGLMDLAVHQAVIDANDTQSGCTAHLVDEQVDNGEILIQKKCAVSPNDTAESLKKRVQALECDALFEACKKLIAQTREK